MLIEARVCSLWSLMIKKFYINTPIQLKIVSFILEFHSRFSQQMTSFSIAHHRHDKPFVFVTANAWEDDSMKLVRHEFCNFIFPITQLTEGVRRKRRHLPSSLVALYLLCEFHQNRSYTPKKVPSLVLSNEDAPFRS